jgi:hypothetical protein
MAGKLAKQKAAEAFDTVVDFLESFEGLEGKHPARDAVKLR